MLLLLLSLNFVVVRGSPHTHIVTPPPAPTIPLAPGVNLPMVVLGTGSGQHSNVTEAVAKWLGSTSGVGIDTALDYFDEKDIAKGLSSVNKTREQYLLETKIPCSSYETANKNIVSNLAQLGVAYVDLMLIHTTNCGLLGSLSGTWRALEEALAAGKTKSIGVSHFTKDDFPKLNSTVKPAVNQCELSVSYHDDATINYCRTNNIVYQAFSPLCGGFNGSSCSRNGGKNVMTVPEVIKIAKVHNVSAAQIGLKWIVQQGFPLTTAVARLDYMNEDLDLWGFGNLTAEEMQQLSAVYPGTHPRV